MTINERIVEIAKSYIGITEITPNAGFSCPIFEAGMLSIGWKTGQPWCTYFAELVWIKAYVGTQYGPMLSNLFSGYAIKTMDNFILSEDRIFKVSSIPVIGSIAIWKHGLSDKGHAAIVSLVHNNHFDTIGGNEGDKVGEKIRQLGVIHRNDQTDNGLNLLGFLNPI